MKFKEESAIFYNLKDIEDYVECYVYFLMKGNEVVYVGQTTQGPARPLSHKDKDFDSFYMISCNYENLNKLENEMILKYKPKYNKNINRINGTIGIREVYNILQSKNICLRGIFIRYAISMCDLRYLTFKNSLFIYKKDFEKLEIYIKENYKWLQKMQDESVNLCLPKENETLDCVYRILGLGYKTIKDLIYFNIITKKDILDIVKYIKKNNIEIPYLCESNYIINIFPKIKKVKDAYNNMDTYKNYKN